MTLPAADMNAFKTSIQLSLRQQVFQSELLNTWNKTLYLVSIQGYDLASTWVTKHASEAT